MSRFLTKSWEHGQRRLHYFDFEIGRLSSASSQSLFATIGTNTQAVEARLNAVIETPVSNAIRRGLLATQPGADESLDWPLIRALTLLLILQPFRSAATTNPRLATRLEEAITQSDAELDILAQGLLTGYRFGRLTVRNDAPLLYPASGFFPLVGQRPDGGWSTAIAVPVTLQHVFVAVPTSLDWDVSTALWAENGSARVHNASIGLTNRVVIPPAAVDATPPAEIDRRLREMRMVNRQLHHLRGEANRLEAELSALYGGV